MSLNEWFAERFTPTDVFALGAVASAVFVGTVALAQGIAIVPGAEAVGLLVVGAIFLVAFGGAVAYVNQKNRESFYGPTLDVEFDHDVGQVVFDDSVALQVRAFPDGPIGDSVTSFKYEFLDGGAQGWYTDGDDGLYFELSLEDPMEA